MAMKPQQKKRLAKLKMPTSSSKHMDLDELMEQEKQETPEEEAAESPEQQAMEEKLGIEMHKPDKSGKEEESEMGEESTSHGDQLASASDEDLVAEIKKRGLMHQLLSEEQSEPSEEEEEESPKEESEEENY